MRLRHIFFITLISYQSILFSQPKKIVIVFVFDQFSYDSFLSLKPTFSGGIKWLLDVGINYENAMWPHFIPSTGPGHAGLSTGALPRVHGIIDNDWFNYGGQEIDCDQGPAETAAVFSPTGLYDFGKSAHHVKIDTISDQIMLKSTKRKSNAVFAIAMKSRAAILTAGRLGKAIWFDDRTGTFTSSKAYFRDLPQWLINFNQKYNAHIEQFFWTSMNLFETHETTYLYSRLPKIINTTIKKENFENVKDYFDLFQHTPEANRLVLEAAKTCLQELMIQSNNISLLWIGLSASDKVGHVYGQESNEYKDIILQTDYFLKEFIEFTNSLGTEPPIYILTADHGGMPIPELLKEKDFDLVGRINSKQLKDQLNELLQNKYNYGDLIREIDPPSIYLSRQLLSKFSRTNRRSIIQDIKKALKKNPKIKNVWTLAELKKSCSTDIREQYAKNHIFPGRTGDLLFQVYPYIYASKYDAGTGHKSPYDYDLHVPLIVCQQNKLTHKQIPESVFLQQIAPTVAYLLEVPRPAASVYTILPSIL